MNTYNTKNTINIKIQNTEAQRAQTNTKTKENTRIKGNTTEKRINPKTIKYKT